MIVSLCVLQGNYAEPVLDGIYSLRYNYTFGNLEDYAHVGWA
jgi:hypothetical protein